MANREDEYKKLRSYLSKRIKGPNTDAILRSVASGPVHLINNIEAVNDSLYIVTAKGKYLDGRLGDKGVIRPTNVGLSDEVFRNVGIEITSRKQVRDQVHQLLRILYGEIYTRATASATELENYALKDGDNLIVSFDGGNPINLVFTEEQFQNIQSATAQEVADAITKSLRKLGESGAAIIQEDSGVQKVVLISTTDGPSSTVKVLGGSAQNVFKFPEIRPTGNLSSTIWKFEQVDGGNIRVTWVSDANPNLGKVKVGDYVNIFSSNFDPNNRGTFTIVTVQDGEEGKAYFEFENPNGVEEAPIEQGSDEGLLFYNPKTLTLNSKLRYAAAYQTNPRTLEVYLPATTKVVRRNRAGAAHIYTHIPEKTKITFPSLAELQSEDSFLLNSFLNLTKYRVIYNIDDSIIDKNFSEKIIEIKLNSSEDITPLDIAKKTCDKINFIYNFSCNDNQDGSIEITNTTGGNSFDVESINMPPSFLVDVITQGTNVASNEGQTGPYVYDPSGNFSLADQVTTTTEVLDVNSDSILFVEDASDFPDDFGDLIIGLGTSHQEGPVPYISKPSDTRIRINPSYKFKKYHPEGTEISLLQSKTASEPSKNGEDFPFYLTDSVAGRIYAEQLIRDITATGIVVIFYILYPNDEGLGKWRDEENSEKYYIWGTEDDLIG